MPYDGKERPCQDGKDDWEDIPPKRIPVDTSTLTLDEIRRRQATLPEKDWVED